MKKLTLFALVLAIFCGSAVAQYVFEDEKSDDNIVLNAGYVYDMYLKYRYVDYDGVYGTASSFWWFIDQKTWRGPGCDEEEMIVFFEELFEKGTVVLRDSKDREKIENSETVRKMNEAYSASADD